MFAARTPDEPNTVLKLKVLTACTRSMLWLFVLRAAKQYIMQYIQSTSTIVPVVDLVLYLQVVCTQEGHFSSVQQPEHLWGARG